MIRTITKALYFFLSLLVAPSFAEYEGEGPSDSYVFATKLNIRETPKPDGKLLIQLRIGEKVSVHKYEDKWVKVSVPGKNITGWTLWEYLYHSPPDMQKTLLSYETTPKTHLLTRKMWAERAMALNELDPTAQQYFKEITEEINKLKSPPQPTKEEQEFAAHQWVYAKSYANGMSWKELAPVKVELSTDKLNPDDMGTVNGSVSDPDSFSNLVKYDFDKDGVDEIVVVGKYWSCFVTEKGCDGKPTQRYVLMVLKRRLLLTDMHRWNDWEVIEMRTDYVVRNVFVAKADDGVRVVSAENSAQCDMDRMDEFKLVWNPAKKKVVASDPTKTSLFNLEPHGYCGE